MKYSLFFITAAIVLFSAKTAYAQLDAAQDGASAVGDRLNNSAIDSVKDLPLELYKMLDFNGDSTTQSPTATPETIQTPSISVTQSPDLTLPPAQSFSGCPPASERIHLAGTRYRHLNRRLPCDKPRMIVVHWSAGWSSAQATFNVLNTRDRSCQFAVDKNEVIQMLDLYPNAVERGWCAGGNANVGSINFEITGAWFDDVLVAPNSQKYADLMVMTDKSVEIACSMMRKYRIPQSAVYGHYELQSGKSDPGVNYLAFFKQRLNQRCF